MEKRASVLILAALSACLPFSEEYHADATPRIDAEAPDADAADAADAGGDLRDAVPRDALEFAAHWELMPSLSPGGGSHTATMLDEGRVLVAGGDTPNFSLTDAALFDLAEKRWIPAAPMREARTQHAAARFGTGAIVVGGNTASTELYDPRADAWIEGPPLIRSRRGHVATAIGDTTVLVAAGLGAMDERLLEIERIDTSSSASIARMFQHRYRPSAVWIPDHGLLIAGGIYTSTSSAELVAGPGGHHFVLLASGAVHDTSMAMLDVNRVLLVGETYDTRTCTAEIYRADQGMWSGVTGLRCDTPFTLTVFQDHVALVTGRSRTTGATADVYVPSLSRFVSTQTAPFELFGATATLLADGSVLFVGATPSADQPRPVALFIRD